MNAARPQPSASTVSAAPVPDLITHDQMRQALTQQIAHPLAPLITDFVHHQDCWWITSPDGWLRIEDAELSRTLDRQQQRFASGIYPPSPEASV